MKLFLNSLLLKYFIKPPHKFLKVLYTLRLDIWCYTLPLFVAYNRKSLLKLYKLKLSGHKPKIVFWAVESDGRFDRVHEISQDDKNFVFFKFHIHLVAVEYFLFAEYAKIKIGFYEDARQKYIAPNNLQSRLEYRKYLHKLFNIFELLIGKIHIFMCGSNNDRYVVELIHTFQKRGGSCIVPEREGTGTDYTFKAEAECFRVSDSIAAHYIYTANNKHREMFEHAKMASVKKVDLLGELDSDWWFHWDRNFVRPEYANWEKYKKKVLFLTFGDRNYIEPFLYPNNPELTWRPLMADCEAAIAKFAKEHSDCLVFYKMGHLADNNAVYLEQCKKDGLANIVPLDRTFPCNELMLYSDCIIGFQTTAMFEAMFTDKPMLLLNWHIPSILDPETQLLPIAKYDACKVAYSKADLERFLEDVANDGATCKPDSNELENRVKTREIMFYKSDGRTAERFYSEIEKIVGIQ